MNEKVKHALKFAVLMTLLLRAIALVWGFTMQTLPGVMEGSGLFDTDWASNLAHWDPELERLVILWGYQPQSVLSSKYPFFSMITRALIQLTGMEVTTAMFVVTTVGVFYGFFALWMLLDYLRDMEYADRVIWYMPFSFLGTGFVFLMSFPEAFHIGFWSDAFRRFFNKDYFGASLFVGLAVLTRPQSIVLLPVFALSILHQEQGNINAVVEKGLKACGFPTLVYVVWTWWVSKITEVGLSPITAQDYFRRGDKGLPWTRTHEWFDWLRYNNPSEFNWGQVFETYHLLLIGVGLIVLAFMVYRKELRWELFLFTLLSIMLPLSTHVFAIGRFALATWMPFAYAELIPQKYDKHALIFNASLTVITMFVLGVSTGPSWSGYVP
ncbi:MAG: hypothetical protein ACOZAO_05255 [Patescibacteria group bacterium]